MARSTRKERKQEPRGAFGYSQPRLVRAVDRPIVGRPYVAPADDGVPYERLGPAIAEVTSDLSELRDHLIWFPATPYMIVLLKDLIRALHKFGGDDGTWLVRALGLYSLDDLSIFNDMEGCAIADLIEQAERNFPQHLREALGWNDGVVSCN